MTTVSDDVLVRFGRWALAKVWFGVVLSGGYAVGRHYDWPQAFLTAAAVLGAVTLALASSFLPIWTRQRPSGIPVADIGLRVMVWGGLAGSVIGLLVGMPAIGMVAAALLLNTAARTFGDPFAPFLRRLRITPLVRYTAPGRRPAPPRADAPLRPAGGARPAGAAHAAGAVHPAAAHPGGGHPGGGHPAGAHPGDAHPGGARPAGRSAWPGAAAGGGERRGAASRVV